MSFGTISSGGKINSNWGQLIENSLGDGHVEQGASYIVFKSDSYYYARSGSTGKIDFGGSGNAGGVDGTDAAAVFQAAIDALTSGGNVFIRSGSYDCSSGDVDVTNQGITFSGEGNSTVLDFGATDCKGFDISASHVTISHLKIIQGQSGNYPNSAVYFGSGGDYGLAEYLVIEGSNYHTVMIEGANDVTVQHCFGDNSADHGIFARECYRPKFLFNTQLNCSDTAFEFYREVYDGLMEGNIGIYESGDSTLDFIAVQGSKRCRVIGNEGYSLPRYGILMGNEGDSHFDLEDNVVEDNILIANTTGARDAGIKIEGQTAKSGKYNVIVGNKIRGFVSGIKVSGATATFTPYHLTICDNNIKQLNEAASIGIDLQYVQLSTISGNTIEGARVGMKFDTCDENIVDGNAVVLNSVFAAQCFQIDNSDENQFSDNRLKGWSDTGFLIQSDSDNNGIKDNMIEVSGTGLNINNANCNSTIVDGNNFALCTTDVSDSGTGTVWGGNVKDDGTMSTWGEDLDP